jgi:hypothetical protein
VPRAPKSEGVVAASKSDLRSGADMEKGDVKTPTEVRLSSCRALI